MATIKINENQLRNVIRKIIREQDESQPDGITKDQILEKAQKFAKENNLKIVSPSTIRPKSLIELRGSKATTRLFFYLKDGKPETELMQGASSSFMTSSSIEKWLEHLQRVLPRL